MVGIRPLREGEVRALVEELWVPFEEALARRKGYVPTAAGRVEAAVEARRERLDRADAVTLVAVDGSPEPRNKNGNGNGNGNGDEDVAGSAGNHAADRPGVDEYVELDPSASGELVGFVAGGRVAPSPVADGPELTVDELYVRPARRREGIATRLLAALEGWGADRSCALARVAVGEGNDPARRLYRSRGYADTDAGMIRKL